MIDKDIQDSAETATDKPAELDENEIADVAGGVKATNSIYGKKGVKFE